MAALAQGRGPGVDVEMNAQRGFVHAQGCDAETHGQGAAPGTGVPVHAALEPLHGDHVIVTQHRERPITIDAQRQPRAPRIHFADCASRRAEHQDRGRRARALLPGSCC